MGKITVWKCDKCKRIYENESEYIQCLKNHEEEVRDELLLGDLEFGYNYNTKTLVATRNKPFFIAVEDGSMALTSSEVDKLIYMMTEFRDEYVEIKRNVIGWVYS